LQLPVRYRQRIAERELNIEQFEIQFSKTRRFFGQFDIFLYQRGLIYKRRFFIRENIIELKEGGFTKAEIQWLDSGVLPIK
jgi:hypothetical protein